MLGLIHVAPLGATPRTVDVLIKERGRGYVRVDAQPWATISSTASDVGVTPIAQADRARRGHARDPVRARLVRSRSSARSTSSRARAEARAADHRRLREAEDRAAARQDQARRAPETCAVKRSWRARVVASLVALAPAAHAQDDDDDTVIYRVKPGRHARADRRRVLRRSQPTRCSSWSRTRCSTPRALKPGERLRIPVDARDHDREGRHVRVARADATSATRGARRSSPTSTACPPTTTLAAGTLLTIPFHVTHTAARRPSRSRASRRRTSATASRPRCCAATTSSTRRAREGRVDRRADLHVRVRAVEAAAGRRRVEGAPRSAARGDRRARAARCPRARAAWLQGDFGDGEGRARAVRRRDSTYLDTATAVEVGVLLGEAHVAFDDDGRARRSVHAACSSASRSYVLTPYADSPKVLAVWKKAGGHVEAR